MFFRYTSGFLPWRSQTNQLQGAFTWSPAGRRRNGAARPPPFKPLPYKGRRVHRQLRLPLIKLLPTWKIDSANTTCHYFQNRDYGNFQVRQAPSRRYFDSREESGSPLLVAYSSLLLALAPHPPLLFRPFRSVCSAGWLGFCLPYLVDFRVGLAVTVLGSMGRRGRSLPWVANSHAALARPDCTTQRAPDRADKDR
jgi:hypothetical protein